MKLEPKKPEVKQERIYDHNDKIQHAIHTGDWIGITQQPDKKCKHCYGTGNHGYDILYEKYQVCKCVK